MPVQLPNAVISYIETRFAQANTAVARQLDISPNTYESTLDQILITALLRASAPTQVAPGWTVRIETHFLGGGRHFGRWEVADIGVLVTYRRQSVLIRTKLALLQSKRLYPVEGAIEDLTREDFLIGFSRLLESDAFAAAASTPRRFSFRSDSTYNELIKGDPQYGRIEAYEESPGIGVHYLLYNPSRIPLTVELPAKAGLRPSGPVRVGARVVESSAIRQALADSSDGVSPRYSDLVDRLPPPYSQRRNRAGRRLEVFVRRLVRCREGYVATDEQDDVLGRVFGQRTGPISAAISVNIDGPIEFSD